jgi:hypothetical protein
MCEDLASARDATTYKLDRPLAAKFIGRYYAIYFYNSGTRYTDYAGF